MSKPLSFTVSQSFFSGLIQATHSAELRSDKMVLAVREIESQVIACDSSDRISVQLLCRYLELISENTGLSQVGLLLGQKIAPACFDLTGHLISSCSTLGDAMSLLQRYHPLVIDCAQVEFVVKEKTFYFYWQPEFEDSLGSRVLVDLVLSAIRRFAVWVTGRSAPCTAIHFFYDQPNELDFYATTFESQLNFSQPKSGLSFPISWCSEGMLSASKQIKVLMESEAEKSLMNVNSEDDFLMLFKRVLEQFELEKTISLTEVAQYLNMSVRTVQRQLKSFGTSFKSELQQFRLRKAHELLTSTQSSILDVALSVGYGEQSSFTHAYKRCFGETPAKTRSG